MLERHGRIYTPALLNATASDAMKVNSPFGHRSDSFDLTLIHLTYLKFTGLDYDLLVVVVNCPVTRAWEGSFCLYQKQ